MPEQHIESEAPKESLDILDDLISRIYQRLLINADENFKTGDLLKMIELRNKLAPSKSEQQEFWKKIAKIRKDAFKKQAPELKPSNEKVK